MRLPSTTRCPPPPPHPGSYVLVWARLATTASCSEAATVSLPVGGDGGGGAGPVEESSVPPVLEWLTMLPAGELLCSSILSFSFAPVNHSGANGGKENLPHARRIRASAVSPQRFLQPAPSRRHRLGARASLVDERDDEGVGAAVAEGDF
nr:unnamed protein product [Digitaria exilis]